MKKKSGFSSQRLSSSFSYSYFTPPCFPEKIQCTHKNVHIDFPTKLLPDLQALRNGISTTNFSLIIAALKQEECEFAKPSIDFLLSKCKGLSSDNALLETYFRVKKRKQPEHELFIDKSRISTQQSPEKSQQDRKRRPADD